MILLGSGYVVNSVSDDKTRSVGFFF